MYKATAISCAWFIFRAAAQSTNPACQETYTAFPGDTCEIIQSIWGITQEQLIQFNPSIQIKCPQTVPDKEYCVKLAAGTKPPPKPTSITSIRPSSTTSSSVPVPTKPTLPPGCAFMYTVHKDDNCWKIANGFLVPLDEFYKHNPKYAPECKNLWVGDTLCIPPPRLD